MKKRFLSLFLVMALVFSLVGSLAPTAAAFSPRTTAPSETDRYWIHTSKGGLNECIIINSTTGSCIPNCVGYAWGRAYEILGSRPDLCKGDAWTWYSYNKNKYDNNNGGYPYSSDVTKPAPGAIAVWSKSGAAGHVAVVESVSGTTVVTSESGYGGSRFWTTTRTTTNSNLSQSSAYSFLGYIYVDGGVQPDKPVLKNFSRSYESGSTSYFYWDETANTTHYNMYVDRMNASGDWDRTYTWFYVNSGYSYAFSDGVYRVCLQSTNSNAPGWPFSESDWVNFAVGPHTHVQGAYAFYEAVHPHYNCYVCTICGEYYREYSEKNYLYSCPQCNAQIVFDPQGGVFPSTCESMDVDNINEGRAADEMTVFTGDGETVDTNIYGYEVAVDRNGLVTGKRGYGDETQLVIPNGGFVLSAHVGSSGNEKPAFVSSISVGEYVAFDAQTMKAYHYTDYDEYLSQQKRVRADSTYGNLPVPTKEGYYFNGWVDNNGQVADYFKEISAAPLTAQWEDINTPASAELIFNNHKYSRYEYNMTWYSAKAFCEAMGGHLATITSADEQSAVESLINGGRNIIYFIGCTDSDVHDKWEWITDEPFSYDNWDPQLPEPAGSERGYSFGGIVNKAFGGNKQFGEWLSNANYPNDLAYTGRICNFGFICEFDTTCHNYVATITSPTCTEQGYTTHTCSVCGDSYVDNYVDALGHNYVNGICTRCNEADPDYVIGYKLTINGSDMTAAPGSTITVPVMITGDAGFAGFTLTVDGSDGLTLTKIEKGALLKAADGMFTPNVAQNVVNWTSSTNIIGSGELLVLTFDVSETVADGSNLTISIALKDGKVSNFGDADEKPVGVKFEDITVTVQTDICGDVNSDGEVDAIDSIRLAKYLVDLVELTPQQILAADVNHDDDITATDAIRLAKYLVGLVDTLRVSPAPVTRAAHRGGSAQITVGAVTAAAGNTVKVPVTISNNPGFAGYTMVITAADGLMLTNIEKGALLNEADGMFTKNVAQSRINWTSSENVTGDGEMMLLTFTVSDSATAGDYSISLALKDGKESNFANADEVAVPVSFNSGKISIPDHIHEYTDVVTPPTCTEQGYTTHTCACGDSYVDSYVPALDHDWNEPTYEWAADNRTVTATRTCKRDAAHIETETVNTTSEVTTPATCTVKGKTTYTATFTNTAFSTQTKTLANVPAFDHDWNEPTYEWAADNRTVTATRTCKRDAAHIETETVNTTSEVTTPATCTVKGKTTYTATFTNPAFTAQTKTVANVSQLGHDIVKDAAKPATCTETGLTEGEHCTRCDYKVAQEVVRALGHDLVADAAVAPTCTETGLTAGEHCTRCDYKVAQEVVPVLGHDLVTDPAVAPTCTETGLTAGEHCTRCDYKITQEVVAALGHDIVADPAKTATCTETGLTAGEHCTRCDYKITQETVPALGHDLQIDAAVAPTCTETGLTQGEHCTRCDYRVTQETVPSLGHDIVIDEAVAPTCNETGLTAGKHCTRCDYKVAQEAVPALGHDIVKDAAKPATCTETGLTEGEHCTRCDYKVAQGTAPALGHDWDEGKVTTPATETTDGVKTFTCQRCGETKTEVIPATGSIVLKNPFVDVKESDYFYDAVLWAYYHDPQITNGLDATHFGPNATCTRGQIVTFLWRALGEPEPTITKNPFVDVKETDYYYKAVLWAVEKGVTNGTDTTHFSPNAFCKREHAVAFLYRAAGNPEYTNKSNPFVDVSTSAYYYDAVLWAVEKNITKGMDAIHFGPSSACQRSQIVTFLYRFMNP